MASPGPTTTSSSKVGAPLAVEEDVVVQELAVPLEDSPEIREAMARSKDLEVLLGGSQMWKVRSFSKWYPRKYYIDADKDELKYEPSHKNTCIAHPRYIRVSEIVDVRRGWKTDIFNKFGTKVVGQQKRLRGKSRPPETDGKPLVDEACCFSIVYGHNRNSLDLVANSPQVAEVWVRALRHVLTVMRGLNQEKRFNIWLQSQFDGADKDKSGTLHFDECLRLLMQMNVNMSKKEALRIFTLADTNRTDHEPSLDAKEFVQFYQLLMKRPEVEDIYHRYARSAREMTTSELRHFLVKEQGMLDVSLDDCQNLIDAFEQSQLKASGRISIHGFTHLICSEQFQVMSSSTKTVYHDMSHPLSSYYLATSHNTYLLGRQVVADSTMEGYVEALKRGCRCIELDCWDGSDGEPVVTHGYALTSKLIFREVLKDAILPNAFTYSEYPLILSLENHCTAEQQKRLAFHISDVFGDLLYLERVSPDTQTLPSPEQLKHRIVIKGRKAAAEKAESESEEDDDDDDDDDDEVDDRRSNKSSAESSSDGEVPHKDTPVRKRSSRRKKKTSVRTKQDREEKETMGREKVMKVTDQTLSDLVNICQGVHFHGFEAEGHCYEMVSLSENKATRLLEEKGKDFIRFNSRRLSRIYPAGSRAGSTNFQPWHFWNAGCQLVALNYQGQGKPVFMNEAKFRDNGGCGFLLKPDFLRLPDFAKYHYIPTATSVKQLKMLRDRRRLLEIKIISGQHLPKPEGDGLGDILDPYVKVKIIGHPIDKGKKQTHAVSDNGFNPRWGCTLQFVVNLPELAFVYFIVKDETPRRHDPVVGVYALPMTAIAPGYRHVPLLNMRRESLEPATLFIHTKITEIKTP